MSTRVALVTDSTCNMPPELAEERRIYITPLYVLWGEESLKDGVDITDQELFQRLAALDSKAELPKTSQVSSQDFIDLFKTARARENADEIVCAVLSNSLSGTYASAMQAKEAVDFPVHVVDTVQISWALGFPVLAAAEARDAGANVDEIIHVITDTAQRSHLIFTVETLDYLHRGGRIGRASKLLGTALQIKPILELLNGVVEATDKARTRKRAVEHIIKLVETLVAGRPVNRLAVVHGNVPDDAQMLSEQAVAKFQPAELYVSNLTAVIGVHVGPGTIGIVVEWKA